MRPPFRPNPGTGRRLALSLALVACCLPAAAGEVATTRDGRRPPGRLAGGPEGFRFVVEGGAPVPIDELRAVDFDPAAAAPAGAVAPAPPFHVDLGLGQRISGRVAGVDARSVRLTGGPGGRSVELDRGGVLALRQRPGEAQVLQEDFETRDATRWAESGLPDRVESGREGSGRAARLPGGSAALTHRLGVPVSSGRLDLAFRDDGRVVEGQQAFLDLQFRGPNGPETVRAVLGWAEESLAVQTPGGPALAVQRLARRPGWHQIAVQFSPGRTELSVDGNDLARGKGPGGPLVEIRLATSNEGGGKPPADLAAVFDDLRLVRFAGAVEGLEVDPSQDEARGVEGDQLFGRVVAADGEGVTLEVDGKPTTLRWAEVSGLHFRRTPAPGKPVDGPLVRLDWRAGPGGEPGADAERDAVEGALVGVDDASIVLDTPYAGRLSIPRAAAVRLTVLGRGRRLMIDPAPHHLGDEVSRETPRLDPPQPEGGVLERTVRLDAAPTGPAELVLDVVQVVGEAAGLPFSNLVRNGELRTKVSLNGREFDYLNRHVATKNELPERIRLPIPEDLLRAGESTFRIEQTGIASDPTYLDDLGVLGVALEFPARPGTPP